MIARMASLPVSSLIFSLSFLFLLLSPCLAYPSHHYNETLTRFAFGSCNRDYLPQPLWPVIAAKSPDFFMWLGDIIYADNSFLEIFRWPASPRQIAEKYAKQRAKKEYQEFVKGMPAKHILGIYDDHDYGENDGNSGYVHKDASQQLLLDFLEEPQDSIRRAREGIYAAYTIGQENGKRVKIIALDTRTFQNYSTGDLLGPQQWRWLEGELSFGQERRSPQHEDTDTMNEPDLIIFVSSIQTLPRSRHIGEGWHNFPFSRTRLLETLVQANINSSMVFISGDIHLAEFLETDICIPRQRADSSAASSSGISYFHRSFVELTSSSLTHSFGAYAPKFIKPILGKITRYILGFGQKDGGIHIDHPELFMEINFGLLTIDWAERSLVAEVVDREGRAPMAQRFAFQDINKHVVTKGDRTVMTICEDEWANRYTAPLNISGISAAFTVLSLGGLGALTVLVIIKKWIGKAKKNNNTDKKKKE